MGISSLSPEQRCVYCLTSQFYLVILNSNATNEPKAAQKTKEDQSKCWVLIQNNVKTETVWNALFFWLN